MPDTVISVENLSKAYQLGVIGTGTFYGDLNRWWARQRGRPDPYLKVGQKDHNNRQGETIWALSDVNFEVWQGQALGIIGRNGAGKSTLLKILSRVTAPTSGKVKVKGRIASLLEVGTGFHPELTGRENIYLNGAILGMSRAEINRKFDEIVDFSGVEKFIDTPVKRYSSGMYVRLAFAVAAHLEPEILVVDEVLAVGDADFQKKCLGKMGDVAHEGRTVLFVSHNMAAISNLCNTCVWIDNGKVHIIGSSSEVVEKYMSHSPNNNIYALPGVFDLTERKNHYGDRLLMRKASLLNAQGISSDIFQMGRKMTIEVELEGFSDYRAGLIGVLVYASDGRQLTSINSQMSCAYVDEPKMIRQNAILDIPRLPFTPGSYSISLSITDGNAGRIDFVDQSVHFQVVESDVYGTGFNVSSKYGVMFLDASWRIINSD
jgi:lipopolysaccharide transport system ATP-binding protein